MTRRKRWVEPKDPCPDCGALKTRSARYCVRCKGKGERNPMYGRPQTEATRRLIAARAPKERPERRGELHPMWKGAAVSKHQGRDRARALLPQRQPCAVCGASKTERHHKDGDTRNNTEENVVFLCRPHHRYIHPGNGKTPLRDYETTAARLREAAG